jgi:hypothetical protein
MHDLDEVNRAPSAEETRGYYPTPHGTVHRAGGIGWASLCRERCTAPDANAMRAELVYVVTAQLAQCCENRVALSVIWPHVP